MLPLKEVLLIFLLIIGPQLIRLMPSIYHQVICVDSNGRLLPEATDSRRGASHFDSDVPISKATVEWYCRTYDVRSSRREAQRETTRLLFPTSNEKNLSAANELGDLDFGRSHLQAL